MSKVVRCDGCASSATSPSLLGSPPEGWFTLSTVGQPDRHYCEASCLVVSLTHKLSAEQKPYLVKEKV